MKSSGLMLLVLDSSTLIAFCKELDDTRLIKKIGCLCSDILIPKNVFEEMTNTDTLRILGSFMKNTGVYKVFLTVSLQKIFVLDVTFGTTVVGTNFYMLYYFILEISP